MNDQLRDAAEAYANINLPVCPECSAHVARATLRRGREVDRGAYQPATATLEPCGHQIDGDAVGEYRAGINWMYKVEPW